MKVIIILFFVIWCGGTAVAAVATIACGFWYVSVIPIVAFFIGLRNGIVALKAASAPPEPAPKVDVEAEEAAMKRLDLEIHQYNDSGNAKPTSYYNIDITIKSPAKDTNRLCDLLHKNYRGEELKRADIMEDLQNPPMKIWLQFSYKHQITEFKKAMDDMNADYTAENTGMGLTDEYKQFLAQNEKT